MVPNYARWTLLVTSCDAKGHFSAVCGKVVNAKIGLAAVNLCQASILFLMVKKRIRVSKGV